MIIIARKFFLSFAIISFTKEPVGKLLLSVVFSLSDHIYHDDTESAFQFVLLVALVLQLLRLPFKIKRFNTLEAHLISISILLLTVGLSFLTPGVLEDTTGDIITAVVISTTFSGT